MADKVAPRVLSNDTEIREPRASVNRGGDSQFSETNDNGPIFEDTLNNGKTVTMREVSANDLLFLERKLGATGELERVMKLAVRISVVPGLISFDEIRKLGMSDMRKISKLVRLASGTKPEDIEDDDDDFADDLDSGGGSIKN